MPRRPLGVLTLGVFVLALAVSAVFLAANVLVNVSEVLSLSVILFGVWLVVAGGMRAANPKQYGAGASNAISGGIVVTTLGSVSFLYSRALFVEFLLPILLLVVATLVVVAGIRAWRK